MSDVKINQKAPLFKLPDQDGKMHSLSAYRGKWVLVYFYPKDSTAGCTKEACGFSKLIPDFKKAKTAIFGISADSVDSHKKFANKHKLEFPLLSDIDRKTIETYGVWKQKKFMGREYMGIARTSFLVDPRGKVVKIYNDVKPAKHPQEVMNDIKS
jgi:peroxiredoxin Q/BCP